MTADLVTYLSDAISRVEAGGVRSPSGSWLAGMFGKGANLFEREVSQFAAGLLNALRLSYPEDLGTVVKSSQPFDKLTLGQLAAVIREVGNRQPRAAAAYIPGRRVARFVDEILKVNATWVDTKHGDEVEGVVLLSRMRTMLKIATRLRNTRRGRQRRTSRCSRRGPRLRSGLAAERQRYVPHETASR
jgi:hypothetical protein